MIAPKFLNSLTLFRKCNKLLTMAHLQLEDGTMITDLEQVDRELAPLQIKLNRWVIENKNVKELLAKPTLNDREKETVLQGLDHYFQELQATAGYQSRDMIVLHETTPNLEALLQKFSACHTHDDDEVRYIVEGEAVFGFVRPDGSQIEVTVQAEDYINVPAGTEHWFHLTHTKQVKAVRYFTDTVGWVPHYTNTPIRFN